jgi:outer membrane protein OmpA-like peptidoglycan-associated protein
LQENATWLEFAAGATVKVNTNLSFYGQFGYEFAVSSSVYRRNGVKGDVGLRYQFGAPPPVTPMPVSEVGAKTFLVFFDWDRADLSTRSQAIVHDAADNSRRTQYTRIDVDGNTDTSGTPQYNMGLSERRARVVANELVRDGVPQSAISMHAFGDTKLLVPTGPGVREPQNRRVEIVYH